MKDRELKKLSREELLKLLIEQRNEIDALKEEIEKMQAKLMDRKIAIETSGSIAEAALRINGVFIAAERAAQQYIENMRLLNERQEMLTLRKEAETK